MQIILMIPLDVSLILFLFCAIAFFALPVGIASMLAPTVGFIAMCLLTLQIYIWYFTKKA